MVAEAINLLGTKVGDFTVTAYLGSIMDCSGNSRALWEITCQDCGAKKTRNQKDIKRLKGVCQLCTVGNKRSKRFGHLLEHKAEGSVE